MTRTLPTSKAEVREMIWRAMEVRGVARFPGAKGRIPNFVGAERAALCLQSLPAWRGARVIKINPDAPQLPVRRLALREGKLLYMAVPRLRTLECFLELDPARLARRALQAASIKGAERLGRPVRLDAVPPIDLIVCGSVAVNGKGARVGKGGGFSDLEYGLLAQAGKVDAQTLIVTTIHPLQMVPQALEMRAHDIPVDVVVTPDGPIRITPAYPRPRGIYAEALTPEKIAEVPVLQRVLGRA
ncbi:MAG TPA: 5-formyltetrahydrofolate cyclo-ligase [Methylomirabilota bacterium]|jgi:5-formyltetrahydrofolate cyclo-ligase|nr:5-formyltetrahydrofolate cyclo-ligase [Methylomirabilota bacterium]